MICSEGYKAFRGTMRIVPKNPNMKPYELTADWLYKPEYQCWYGRGSSFPEEICEVVVDLTAPPLNPPLTLDQLREMDGEPVYLDLGDGGEWALVRMLEGKVFITHKNTICVPVNILFGRGGKVYRRKPGEGDV